MKNPDSSQEGKQPNISIVDERPKQLNKEKPFPNSVKREHRKVGLTTAELHSMNVGPAAS